VLGWMARYPCISSQRSQESLPYRPIRGETTATKGTDSIPIMTQSALDTPPTQNAASRAFHNTLNRREYTRVSFAVAFLGLLSEGLLVGGGGDAPIVCVLEIWQQQPPVGGSSSLAALGPAGGKNNSLHGYWLGPSHYHNSSLIYTFTRLAF
jgi:hypothetical protein